jgi:hypothetical protein
MVWMTFRSSMKLMIRMIPRHFGQAPLNSEGLFRPPIKRKDVAPIFPLRLINGIVPNLAKLKTYLYCGHSALMGKKKRPWQDVDYVLYSFGKTVHGGRRAYFPYV